MRRIMFLIGNTGVSVIAALALAAILSFQIPNLKAADDGMVTQATLLDRIQIEDLMVNYYSNLSSGDDHDLAQFFTEDAILDVNGQVSKGRKAIEELYGSLEAGGTDQQGGVMHVLLTNPVIKVKGDTARAWVIWTGVMNDSLKAAPRLLEQGREYSELVKLDGKWFIRKRYITADSGMPDIWDKTYKPREFK
jgi:uncharacterized protein (TIGR02246 family)